MARLADRHPSNVPGSWYVDTRCIGCDVARHYAPGLTDTVAGGQSVISRQPSTPDEERQLWRAALACPTRSIGTEDHQRAPDDVFPFEVGPGLFLCGHNDRRSFGAHSWFVPRPQGSCLVDSPHWDAALVAALEQRGGLAHVLLTHRDDVADAERYASHFGARVWIHRADHDAAPFATDLLDDAPYEIAAGLVAFPVPGHTEGSVVYLLEQRYLFSGDSLAWSWRRGDLEAFSNAAWYSWSAQRASLRRFLDSGHRFEWICPGHGAWQHTSTDDMAQRLAALLEGADRADMG